MAYFIKFFIAGGIVACASYLSKLGHNTWTSLLVTAPIIITITFLILAKESSRESLETVARTNSIMIPVLLIYTLSVYILSKYTSLNTYLLIAASLAIWAVCAFVILKILGVEL